jgi:DNA (cytosine-5)-methyltransferase 1
VLENVKHLVHHHQGKTLATIMYSLEDLGYFVDYRVLNSQNFGIPQNRERIIIVASLSKKFDFSSLNFSHSPSHIRDFLCQGEDFEYLDPQDYTLIDNPVKQDSGLLFVGYRNKSIRKNG